MKKSFGKAPAQNRIRWILFILVNATLCNLTLASSYNTNKIASVCRIWGFLKYHHPVVIKGKLDWDSELIRILNVKDSTDFNTEMIKWIKGLGIPKPQKIIVQHKLEDNESLKWINNDPLIDDSLRVLLNLVYSNRLNKQNYYVKPFFINGSVIFSNEKIYQNMDFSNANMRILAVARYWNAINYFYPYLKLTDSNWNNILPLAIDKMKSGSSREDYVIALRWLVKNTCDGHNNISIFYTFKRDSLKWTPYTYKIDTDKIWVDGFYTEKLIKDNKLMLGDEIVSVDNQTVSEHIKFWEPYLSASNNKALLNSIAYFALSGYDSTIVIKVKRKDSIIDVALNRYSEKFLIEAQANSKPLKDSLINGIPYLNLAEVSRKEIEQFIKKYFQSRAMIIDLRNYPKDDPKFVFAKYLLNERKKFADVKLMDINNPGTFRKMTKDSSIWDWSWIGGSNKNIYKGKVILLVDANTISHAEYTAMAMQTMPQVFVVGNQTGGANGNVTTFTLPGNIRTSMSSVGICYPDGTQTQRKGIRLDIVVNEVSSNNLRQDDIILKKALEYLSHGN